MSVLAVPKDKQGVTVCFDKGEKAKGSIFLERYFESLSILNKMTAFLEREDASIFVPFQQESGITEFLNKDHILIVELDNVDVDGLDLAFFVKLNVAIVLSDDSLLTGTLLTEAPAEKSRLSDCLNIPNGFLAVKSGDKLVYVNKHMIKKVMLIAA